MMGITEKRSSRVEELRVLWNEGIASGEARPMTEAFTDLIKSKGRELLASPDEKRERLRQDTRKA